MAEPLINTDNLLLGGGVPVYSSTIRDILLRGQNERNTHYTEPYLLQAIRVSFKHLMNKGDWLFVVRRDIYSPNNTSVLHIDKCYPRFAQAHLVVRNGLTEDDVNIPEDINYAELLNHTSHETLKIFDPHKETC